MKKLKIAVSILLSFGLVFSFAGCKDKGAETQVSEEEQSDNTTTQKEEKTTTEMKKELSTVTYESFKNIKIGDTYLNCASVIGEANKVLEANEQETYTWNMEAGASASVITKDGVITSKSQVSLNNSVINLTNAQYEQVQAGMTLDQVKALIGEGRLTLEEKTSDGKIRSLYSYYNQDYSSAILTFQDGTLYSKSQNNLK